jgi:hypothetical protein
MASKVSDDESSKHSEEDIVPKPSRQSTAGQKKQQQSNNENTTLPKFTKKPVKRAPRSQMAPKSKATITDSDESTEEEDDDGPRPGAVTTGDAGAGSSGMIGKEHGLGIE